MLRNQPSEHIELLYHMAMLLFTSGVTYHVISLITLEIAKACISPCCLVVHDQAACYHLLR